MTEVLDSFSYGVYVVSSRGALWSANGGGEDINAMTMRLVSHLPTRPARISLVMRKRCLTHEFICESRVFAVNVLAQGQEMIAGHFGLRSGRNVDKFIGINYKRGCLGAPILDECRAFLECRLVASHDMGNTVLLIGEIVHTGKGALHNRPSLMYRKDDYYG